MHLRNGMYIADKGNYFVLTEKGKANCASYHGKTIGKPVSNYEDEASRWDIEKSYLKEVPIPDWIIKSGYKVVYSCKGNSICVGNPIVFPERELAENYRDTYSKKPWLQYKELRIIEALYEGRAPKPRRVCNNKPVYNQSWYFGIDALQVGSYVEEEIVEELRNCLPPACDRSSCMQLGEAAMHALDERRIIRPLFHTFKKIKENTWEYCGACFRGENTSEFSELPYIKEVK